MAILLFLLAAALHVGVYFILLPNLIVMAVGMIGITLTFAQAFGIVAVLYLLRVFFGSNKQ